MSANVCMMAQHAQQVTRAEAVRAGMTWLNGSNHQSDRAIQNSRLVEKMDGAGNVVLYEHSFIDLLTDENNRDQDHRQRDLAFFESRK